MAFLVGVSVHGRYATLRHDQPARRLIVVVDGPQHAEDEHVARDQRRDRWLDAEGYRAMRFQTADVYRNLGGVVDTIWAALRDA